MKLLDNAVSFVSFVTAGIIVMGVCCGIYCCSSVVLSEVFTLDDVFHRIASVPRSQAEPSEWDIEPLSFLGLLIVFLVGSLTGGILGLILFASSYRLSHARENLTPWEVWKALTKYSLLYSGCGFLLGALIGIVSGVLYLKMASSLFTTPSSQEILDTSYTIVDTVRWFYMGFIQLGILLGIIYAPFKVKRDIAGFYL